VDPIGQPRRAARQAGAETPEPAARLLGFRRGYRNGRSGGGRLGCDDFRRLGRKGIGIRSGFVQDAATPEPHAAGTPIRLSPSAVVKRIRITDPVSGAPSKRTAA